MRSSFAQAIHDRDAEAVLGDGFDENAIKPGCIESAKFREEGGGSFAEVTGG